MQVSATHIAYLYICRRKLWLFSNGIRLENAVGNNFVEEGKFIHETTYAHCPHKFRELDLGFIKIDHFDPIHKLVREVKKSNKLETAHIAQLKYYLFLLEQMGVQGVKGLLEYPKLKKTHPVLLTDDDRAKIPHDIEQIKDIVQQPACPPFIRKPYCRRCAYYDFCYSGES